MSMKYGALHEFLFVYKKCRAAHTGRSVQKYDRTK